MELSEAERENRMKATREYCRIPGTRCNAIMSMIEKGFSLETVAKKFHTDEATVKVYKKAMEGKLTWLGGDSLLVIRRRDKAMDMRRARVIEYYYAGLKYREIAEAMGISINSVADALKAIMLTRTKKKWHGH